MLTEYEAQKLQHDYKPEFDVPSGVVLKCAAGLLVVVALALIAPGTDLRRDVSGDSAPAATHSAAQHADRTPIAEAVKTVEERSQSPQVAPAGARRVPFGSADR